MRRTGHYSKTNNASKPLLSASARRLSGPNLSLPPTCNNTTDQSHSGLLELCLDLNQNPSIPPELRFDVSLPARTDRTSAGELFVNPNISPEEANQTELQYKQNVRNGQIPPLYLAEARAQIDARLAEQGPTKLGELESGAAHLPVAVDGQTARAENELGFMSFDEENEYLARLDARLSMSAGPTIDPRHRDVEQEKHYAELTPRELERKSEFENPQSQHNWLKTHTKVLGGEGEDGDTESIASHDLGVGGGQGKGKRKSGVGPGKGSLAKQVGDRAVERAREGSTALGSNDEDELASDVGHGGAGTGRKRAKDPDGTYRVKGGKSAAGPGKGKRKRSGEDVPGAKKPRMEAAASGGPGTAGSGVGGSGGMGMG